MPKVFAQNSRKKNTFIDLGTKPNRLKRKFRIKQICEYLKICNLSM